MTTKTWIYAALVATCTVSCVVNLPAQAIAPSGPTVVVPLPSDLSQAVVETTMRHFPNAADLGKWGYQSALYLLGEYQVYQRTGDKRYLDYIESWANTYVDASGKISNSLNSLDSMLAGNLLLVLFHETGNPRYATAARSIRTRLDTYPRTADGALWHATSRQHQLWLDGTYMSLPFLVHYGNEFGESKYAYDEAAKNLLTYAHHLNDPKTGLLFHAYDESGTQPWAQPETHHSSFFWCRSIGWFGMALVDVLEKMPKDHPDRPKLIALVRQLARAYTKYQDPATGLWFNVVDQPKTLGNWLETSGSSMYVYMLEKAIERGYIGPQYQRVACKGYGGVLSQITATPDGDVHIANICEGTNVSDLSYYLNRARKTDDEHGLGAFLLMNEVMRKSQCASPDRAAKVSRK